MVYSSTQNCSAGIDIGLVVDPPNINACYKDTLIGKPCANDTGPGIEFEFMMTILKGFLHINRFTSVYEADSFEQLNRWFGEKKFQIFFNSYRYNPTILEEQRNVYATQTYVYGGIGILQKQFYQSSRSKIYTIFNMDLWFAIIGYIITAYVLIFGQYNLDYRFLSARPRSAGHSTRVPYSTVWFIVFSILAGLFSNMLAITYIKPNTRTSFSFDSIVQLSELIATKICTFVVLRRYENDEDFYDGLIKPKLSIQQQWARNMRRAFEVNPPILVEDREKMVGMVNSSTVDKCFVGVDYSNMDEYYVNRYCNLRLRNYQTELETRIPYVFYFRGRHCLKPYIDAVFTTEAVKQYPVFLAKKYHRAPHPIICPEESKLSRSYENLDLHKISDAFILLILGHVIACVLLFMEHKFSVAFAYFMFIPRANTPPATSGIKAEVRELTNWNIHRAIRARKVTPSASSRGMYEEFICNH